ncbi:GNAT family N-acetyltransferase [Kribbella kalugense]|uniref:Acetyltransferase (GNAT) family protein n=1 Tax=Kribbella kalugense TaxID=2512221 RepID=A0A4R7ZJD7_9ACTN|nr:GNAT family protein [Kribbella kalugense]TDW17522.1 hypothetical protein EV650_4089 [Kribbella kalugense]
MRFAVPLTESAELRPLEPWQAPEFLAHVDKARDALAPNRVEWRCAADNGRSGATAGRLGMVLEGTLRQAFVHHGVHDVQVWAMTRADWERRPWG